MHCRVEPTCGQDVRKYIREVQDAHGQMPVAMRIRTLRNAEKTDYPSGMISSRMFTSCTSPLVTRMNVGMLPCRSSRVCILTAALRRRNLAHGNNDKHRSIVVESRAYKL